MDKLAGFQRNHAHFSKRGRAFTVKHYAGDVEYSVAGFCEANKDTLVDDLVQLLRHSSTELVADFFGAEARARSRLAESKSAPRFVTWFSA